jgi:hypothetical protein
MCGGATEHGTSAGRLACERIFDEPVDGVWASDHFGVVADLSARPRADDRCTDLILALMHQDELGERFPDGLAQPHARLPPPHPPAQDALHVLEGVPFQDG